MKTPLAVAALTLLLASPAFAQSPDDRIRVSFGAGLTAGAVDGGPSIAASAGYRFADRVSFDVEFTFADEAADRFANRLFPLTNDLDFGDTTRHAVRRLVLRSRGECRHLPDLHGERDGVEPARPRHAEPRGRFPSQPLSGR
jgi:hypothetical protein